MSVKGEPGQCCLESGPPRESNETADLRPVEKRRPQPPAGASGGPRAPPGPGALCRPFRLQQSASAWRRPWGSRGTWLSPRAPHQPPLVTFCKWEPAFVPAPPLGCRGHCQPHSQLRKLRHGAGEAPPKVAQLGSRVRGAEAGRGAAELRSRRHLAAFSQAARRLLQGRLNATGAGGGVLRGGPRTYSVNVDQMVPVSSRKGHQRGSSWPRQRACGFFT